VSLAAVPATRRPTPVTPPARAAGTRRPRLAYVVNLFPNLIETMIFREVEALRGLGFEIHTFSLRRPDVALVPPEARGLADTTYYLLPMSLRRLVLRQFTAMLRRPVRYWTTLLLVLTGAHDGLRSRLRSLAHVLQGFAMLREVQRLGVDHIHAHWATGATTCSLVLSRMLDRPFSFTAHAYDIWRERLALPQKLGAARFVVTCTDYNAEHLASTYGMERGKIHTVHHGTDVERFSAATRGERPVPTVIAVGRLVEQKGLDRLVAACGRLAADRVSFRCLVVGDGPLRASLEAAARAAGIADRIEFCGQVFQDELVRLYATADVFALFCQPASDDDRDGIPNVMIEAMATGLPVVSTRFSGIPELVVDGETGLLAEVDDGEGQVTALRRALTEPSLRARLGCAARERVEREFTVAASAATLAGLFASLPVQRLR
jgi:glycosyltransferase involved in cell wall biosynthesis